LREAVDQRAPETEILDAAHELRRSAVGVLHRQCRNADEAIRPLCDLLRQHVVRLARHIYRPLDIGDRLDGRGIERRDHDLDAGGIHKSQPLVLEIEEARTQFRPHMGAEDLRIAERGRGREMILERDFPLHVPSGTTTIGVPDYARTRPRLPASRAPWRFPEMK
jgi:hypothetical protein